MHLTIITGDHYSPDFEKPEGKFGEEEFKSHQTMIDAFKKFPDLSLAIINNHDQLLEKIQHRKPELVVNFCDTGYKNQIKLESNIPAYLEILNMPYTGATPANIIFCYDKTAINLIAQSINIPIPKQQFFYFDESVDFSKITYPALIKPNTADGSFGITKDAVVHNVKEAGKYLNWLKQNLPKHDLLIQEFLSGTEYSVGLIGNPETELIALPILEVDYSNLPSGLNQILSYESKSVPTSPYWTDIHYTHAKLNKKDQQQIINHSIRLFKRLKLRDYARIDFRKDKTGTIKLLEVNPNPAWCSDGKLAYMAKFAGISYPDFLRKIIDVAYKRIHKS